MISNQEALSSEPNISPSQNPVVKQGLLAGIKKRIKKVYDCLTGSETCSPDEIILARVSMIIAGIEIYRTMHAPLWWLERQRQHVLQQKTKALSNSTDVIEEVQCCICFGKENLGGIPCISPEVAHSSQVCINCLVHLKIRKASCPVCRAVLNI